MLVFLFGVPQHRPDIVFEGLATGTRFLDFTSLREPLLRAFNRYTCTRIAVIFTQRENSKITYYRNTIINILQCMPLVASGGGRFGPRFLKFIRALTSESIIGADNSQDGAA